MFHDYTHRASPKSEIFAEKSISLYKNANTRIKVNACEKNCNFYAFFVLFILVACELKTIFDDQFPLAFINAALMLFTQRNPRIVFYLKVKKS